MCGREGGGYRKSQRDSPCTAVIGRLRGKRGWDAVAKSHRSDSNSSAPSVGVRAECAALSFVFCQSLVRRRAINISCQRPTP